MHGFEYTYEENDVELIIRCSSEGSPMISPSLTDPGSPAEPDEWEVVSLKIYGISLPDDLLSAVDKNKDFQCLFDRAMEAAYDNLPEDDVEDPVYDE